METFNYKVSWKVEAKRLTLVYRDKLISNGMIELSKTDFLAKLKELGYKIDNVCSFNYYNTLNDDKYLAKSVAYINTKTNRSAFHFEESFSNPEQLEKLQEIRRNFFVFDGTGIWEL